MARHNSLRGVRSVYNPEIINLINYVFKPPKHNKEVKDYTKQTDAFDSGFKLKPMNKHKYAYKIKSIGSNNIDNSTENEMELLNVLEPQFDRRKHSISSEKRDKQPEHVIGPKRNKKPTFHIRNYNMLTKRNNTKFKKSRKKIKPELPERPTMNYSKLPEFHLNNGIRRTGDNKTHYGPVLVNTNAVREKYELIPEMSMYVYNKIPRFDYNLNTMPNSTFDLSSHEYIFVSSFLI